MKEFKVYERIMVSNDEKDWKERTYIFKDDKFYWCAINGDEKNPELVRNFSVYSVFPWEHAKPVAEKEYIPLDMDDIELGHDVVSVDNCELLIVGKNKACIITQINNYTYQELFDNERYKINGKPCRKEK